VGYGGIQRNAVAIAATKENKGGEKKSGGKNEKRSKKRSQKEVIRQTQSNQRIGQKNSTQKKRQES